MELLKRLFKPDSLPNNVFATKDLADPPSFLQLPTVFIFCKKSLFKIYYLLYTD